MPPKKKVDLPDHVRAAVLGDVALDIQQALDADERSKIRVYLAIQQGLTTHEMAEHLRAQGYEVSQQTLSRWNRQGEEAYKRRESARDQQPGEDPVRSGEREPVG